MLDIFTALTRWRFLGTLLHDWQVRQNFRNEFQVWILRCQIRFHFLCKKRVRFMFSCVLHPRFVNKIGFVVWHVRHHCTSNTPETTRHTDRWLRCHTYQDTQRNSWCWQLLRGRTFLRLVWRSHQCQAAQSPQLLFLQSKTWNTKAFVSVKAAVEVHFPCEPALFICLYLILDNLDSTEASVSSAVCASPSARSGQDVARDTVLFFALGSLCAVILLNLILFTCQET